MQTFYESAATHPFQREAHSLLIVIMETNVKVAVRCRPLSRKEMDRGCTSIIKINDNSVHIDTPPEDNSSTGKVARDFKFDHSYDINSTQEQVYVDLGGPVVAQALDGFNCTIFAYGQTGSGKSHSMMGYERDLGIIPRLNDDLWSRIFDLQAKASQPKASTAIDGKTEYMVTVSFLEIYNEEIKDLLNPKKHAGGMKIRESPELGIYVEDLCELIVKDSFAVMKLIEQGNTVRKVAATNMNDQSSRSHSVFTIRIEQNTETILDNGMTKVSLVKAKINLVDLAGSERAEKTGATGKLLQEGANINLSLMALGNVINALSEAGSANSGGKKVMKHIPYRDSKLTRLLQESLGGNAATVMIAAISPADYNYDETLSTLKYANRAKSIANAVTKNEDVNQRMINDLKKEIEALRAQVASGGKVGGMSDEETQRRIHEMEDMQRNSWEEKQKLAKQLEEERQANMNVVMSDMMADMKEKKVSQMKNIKKLSNEKTTLQKKMKDGKSQQAQLKEEVDEDLKRYADMQAKYDEELHSGREHLPDNEALARSMADLLGKIEGRKAQWIKMKEEAKELKERLAKIEEEMTNERAELVATAGLLDQNDKLRDQIQAEERERAKKMIEAEIEATKLALEAQSGSALEKKSEQITMLDQKIKDQQVHMGQLKLVLEEKDKELERQVKYANTLEEKLSDAEALLEAAQLEIASNAVSKEKLLQSQLQQTELEELRAKLETLEKARYEMFSSLMDHFNAERRELLARYRGSQDLLVQATQDIVHLAGRNSKLQEDLEQALLWEPKLRSK